MQIGQDFVDIQYLKVQLKLPKNLTGTTTLDMERRLKENLLELCN